MLERKLCAEFASGNRKARESLYSRGGAFSSLSSKIAVAYCAGWLDSDLFHDLSLLRKVRNGFAHELAPCSPDAKDIREQLENLKTPHRIYSDWGEVRAAEIENGIILYSGDKPEETQGDLALPGLFALKMGIPAVIGVLADALQIEIEGTEGSSSAASETGGQPAGGAD
ncbi:MAG: hypothetical protein JW993_13525 [Sedimentisphaerales bacterium]|nr:hypothetical protein [Sedimentisphaerales bacterium]